MRKGLQEKKSNIIRLIPNFTGIKGAGIDAKPNGNKGVEDGGNTTYNQYIHELAGHKLTPSPAINNILTLCFVLILVGYQHDH